MLQYTATFGGSTETLRAAIGLATTDPDPPFTTLVFQAHVGNGNVCYVAGDNTGTISSSVFSFSFPATPAESTRVVLVSSGSRMKLSQFKVLGTAGQKLAVSGIPF